MEIAGLIPEALYVMETTPTSELGDLPPQKTAKPRLGDREAEGEGWPRGPPKKTRAQASASSRPWGGMGRRGHTHTPCLPGHCHVTLDNPCAHNGAHPGVSVIDNPSVGCAGRGKEREMLSAPWLRALVGLSRPPLGHRDGALFLGPRKQTKVEEAHLICAQQWDYE